MANLDKVKTIDLKDYEPGDVVFFNFRGEVVEATVLDRVGEDGEIMVEWKWKHDTPFQVLSDFISADDIVSPK